MLLIFLIYCNWDEDYSLLII